MAGKPKPMSQIKQLIRLYQAGTGKKTIARDLGLSKNTVKATGICLSLLLHFRKKVNKPFSFPQKFKKRDRRNGSPFFVKMGAI